MTALNPRIGYDRAVKIGKLAGQQEKVIEGLLGYVRRENFNRLVVPAAMTVPGATLPGGGG